MGVWGKAQPMKSNMFSNLAMNYATNICINGFINWNKLHGINLIVVGQASKDWNIFGPDCPGLVVVGYVFRVCPRENHTGKPEMGNVHPLSIPNYSNDRGTLQTNEPWIHPFSRFIHVYPFAKWFVFPGVTLRKVREVNHGAWIQGPSCCIPLFSGSVYCSFNLEKWRLILRLIRGC